MDRREALQKIGVGGAVVAGATLISTSPAFAYTSPTETSQPDAHVNGGGKTSMTITVAAGAGTCSGSAVASDATNVSLKVETRVISVATAGTRYGFGTTAAAATTGGAEFTSATVTITPDPDAGGSFSIRHVDAAGTTLLVPTTGDTIELRTTAKYQCDYTGGNQQASYVIRYQYTFNGSTWTQNGPLTPA